MSDPIVIFRLRISLQSISCSGRYNFQTFSETHPIMRQNDRRFSLKLIPAVALTLAITTLTPQTQAQTTQKFPTTQLNIGIHLIKAEVAKTEAEREQGLMFREKMGENEGMLFLFGQPAGVCMWMKNTLIPLSVAFLDEKGEIINIEEMKEQTTNSHCAKRGATYALEMNKAWFKQKNIKPGTRINGLPQ